MSSYTLVELAERADVTPRTVRFYQATGLLQRPHRAGRGVHYDDGHADRLRHIADLRARGLKLEAIRDLVQASSVGKPPAVALLGPELATEQWLSTSAVTVNAVELAELLGERALGLVPELAEHGYLELVETDDGPRWRVEDLPLLRGALQLAELGTDIELSARARDLLRRRTRRMARDFVRMWAAGAGALDEGEATSAELELLLDRVRAVAWQSAAHVMATEIDRAVRRADALSRSEDADADGGRA